MLKQLLKYIYIIPTLCLAITVLYFAKANFPIVAENIKSTAISEFDTTSFDSGLQENFNDKYFFINLNGAMTRYLGINTLNERQRLSNGYLARFGEELDLDKIISEYNDMATFLEKNNIPYLFSIIPGKEYFYGTPFSPGYDENLNDIFDEVVNTLEQRNINILNMDKWFEENNWGIEDVYFATDHHWLPEAAFQTSKLIMEELDNNEVAYYDESTLDMDNWTVEVYKEYFLGSDGKRTGTKYAKGGVDDISYIYPNYEADIYLTFPDTETTHVESLYDSSQINGRDYFNKNNYMLYLGSDYPFVHINNKKAVNQKTIIIVGDSYKMPIDVFLSTQFTDIYHVDFRYYHDMTFEEIVELIEPDVVLTVYMGLKEANVQLIN